MQVSDVSTTTRDVRTNARSQAHTWQLIDAAEIDRVLRHIFANYDGTIGFAVASNGYCQPRPCVGGAHFQGKRTRERKADSRLGPIGPFEYGISRKKRERRGSSCRVAAKFRVAITDRISATPNESSGERQMMLPQRRPLVLSGNDVRNAEQDEQHQERLPRHFGRTCTSRGVAPAPAGAMITLGA